MGDNASPSRAYGNVSAPSRPTARQAHKARRFLPMSRGCNIRITGIPNEECRLQPLSHAPTSFVTSHAFGSCSIP
eukprot:scaffold233907_cov36-Tisochrysis_lutea.AAC.5